MLSALFLAYLAIARLLGIIKYDLGFFFHFGNDVDMEKYFRFHVEGNFSTFAFA